MVKSDITNIKIYLKKNIHKILVDITKESKYSMTDYEKTPVAIEWYNDEYEERM